MYKISRLIFLFAAIIAIMSLALMLFLKSQPKPEANISNIVSYQENTVAGDFVLTDQNGRLVDAKDFRGKFLLMYFGFTFCPDICPSSLSEIGKIIENLGSKADMLQPIFITIDPERDNATQLKSYFLEFNPRILPLTGSREQINAVADRFKVYYAIAPEDVNEKKNYMINHSSFYYLVDKEGKLLRVYAPNTSAEEMSKDIELYLN